MFKYEKKNELNCKSLSINILILGLFFQVQYYPQKYILEDRVQENEFVPGLGDYKGRILILTKWGTLVKY